MNLTENIQTRATHVAYHCDKRRMSGVKNRGLRRHLMVEVSIRTVPVILAVFARDGPKQIQLKVSETLKCWVGKLGMASKNECSKF